MAKLVTYGMLSTNNNIMAGNLVKVQCEICGRKFGSIEEARKCETRHISETINDLLKGELNEKNTRIYTNRNTI